MKAIKKCLVTGGAGFIGSHLVERLIREGYEIVVIDNLSTGKKENLNPKANFYKADICDLKITQIFKKEKPDAVFHFAAQINARKSIKEPIFDAKTNILGSLNVLENCRKYKVSKIIFASSGGEIYGEVKKLPIPETHFPFPQSPYGVGKLAIEKYLDSYFKIFHLPYISLRYGNVYGPRQNPKSEAGVIAIFITKMLKNEQPIIYGDGNQTKDYIFIDDAIEATLSSFKKRFRGILNVGTSQETSPNEIFWKLKRIVNEKCKKVYAPAPPTELKRVSLSIDLAKKVLKWKPRIDLDQGLIKTVNWYKSSY